MGKKDKHLPWRMNRQKCGPKLRRTGGRQVDESPTCNQDRSILVLVWITIGSCHQTNCLDASSQDDWLDADDRQIKVGLLGIVLGMDDVIDQLSFLKFSTLSES